MSYTNIFGNSAVRPAQPSYLALGLPYGENVQLYWPLETTESVPVVAAMIDVTAYGGSLDLIMPPGNTGSNGVQSMITNVGSNTFNVTDVSGNTIATIPTTQSWLIALTDNTTTDGTWSALQMASTTSSATAAALAGDGLIAIGSLLYPNSITNITGSNFSLGFSDRLRMSEWSGASNAIYQLGPKATLTAGWLTFVKNNTAAYTVTVSTTGGETIDGGGPITLEPGEGAIIVCDTTGFFTIRGITGPVNIPSGGTGADNAPDALTNLGGTAIGTGLFTAANAAAARALLGVTTTTLTEATISTDQSLNSGSANTAFVCTSALIATLPLTTDLTTSFIVAFYAENGALTLRPQITDKINNGVAGADVIIASSGSLLLTTDANGNWWPFFLSGGNAILSSLFVSGNTTLVGTATIGGTLAVAGAATLGGAVTLGSTLKVAGATTLTGAASVGSSMTVTGALVGSTDGTTAKQVVNYSQFPYTSGAPGTETMPSGRIMKWGTGSTASGAGTVNFAVAFPTACDAVLLTISGGTATLTVHPIVLGAKSASTFAVWGDAIESVAFNWLAIGH